MHLPITKRESRYKRSIITFGGLNLTQSYSQGEMSNCSGISHREFPALTQRPKSENIFGCMSPSAVIFENKECVAADDGLYYDRKRVGDLSVGKKQLVTLGSKIIVFPDKMYYDTQTQEFKSLSGRVETQGAKVTFTGDTVSVPESLFVETREIDKIQFHKESPLITYASVKVDNGNVIGSELALKKATELEAGVILLEKCNKNQYRLVESVEHSDDSDMCEVTSELITTENVIKDLFASFKVGDVVEISGCEILEKNNLSGEIIGKTDTSLTFAEGTFTSGAETESITIQRKIPDFTCMCSYENRLWGCEGNTIYASALGDVTNFFIYKGLSTDSFTVASNSAGEFTACVPYGNSCFFFKETSCYKLYGNRPANFQITQSFGTGILKDDAKSIVNTGGKLIYKGNGGVYMFYGGTPQCISDKLGSITMENAAAGSNGRLYYLSVDTKDGREEYVWDIEKNLWSKTGIRDVLGYASYGDTMYRLKNDGIEKILQEADSEAEWSVTFCPFDEGYYNTKNYSRLHIRVQLFEGAYIHTEVRDDDTEWKTINTSYGDNRKYLNIPCVVKSCHRVQLRLSGKGRSILESITREFSVN